MKTRVRGRLPTGMIAAGIAAGLALCVFSCWPWFGREPQEKLLRDGHKLLLRRQFAAAKDCADRVLARTPDSAAALQLAAEAEIGANRPEVALSFLSRIPDDGSSDAVAARLRAARLLLHDLKRLEPAEAELQRLLAMDPASPDAAESMAYILGLESRSWESVPFRLQLAAAGRSAALMLFSLSLGINAMENPEDVRELAQQSPNDNGVRLALARVCFETRQYDKAERLAVQVLQERPALDEATARLGLILVEIGDPVRFENWDRGMSGSAEAHPGVWYARGLRAAGLQQHAVAARCLWETLRRDPNHPRACYQLGQSLIALGRAPEAEVFLERSRRLEDYARTAELAFRLGEADDALSAALQARSLGLLQEALGWAAIARETSGGPAEAAEMFRELKALLPTLPPDRNAPDTNPADLLDLTEYPIRSADTPQMAAENGRSPAEEITAFRFDDVAAQAGLDFEYRNGGDPRSKGLVRMYEVVGGGMAATDYDLDGHTDLWFAQGTTWPPGADGRPAADGQPGADGQPSLDQLCRNTGDSRFIRVTQDAGIAESGFSQGVAAGDLNNDGFPDLYVANIGQNTVILNNGDGTFQDVTQSSQVDGDAYTSSTMIADVNGDTLPDLVAVNYLAGEDLFTRVCGDETGFVGSCLPHLFDSAEDELWLGRGDGTFSNATAAAGFKQQTGKGLGIIGWDADGSGRLSLFIANDIGPNFLLVNEAARGAPPRFVDRGLTSGLAFNGNGRSESSMGAAMGDYDGNGLPDIFVTNFDEETNTLYQQQPGGLFVDATAKSELHRKRGLYVGWGTQFLDADLDGWPDLVLTNGHVNDVSRSGRPFRMPAQILRNVHGRRFQEIPPDIAGPFFQRNLLGRGLARLDWNNDGREDFVISHLDAPAALLSNQTATSAHCLVLELHGVDAARDAVGTSVSVTTRDRTFTRQLTAGDGNQVSNQRRLVFGLGTAEQVDQITIRWFSGTSQTFSSVPVDTGWVCIEGRSQLLRQPELLMRPVDHRRD